LRPDLADWLRRVTSQYVAIRYGGDRSLQALQRLRQQIRK